MKKSLTIFCVLALFAIIAGNVYAQQVEPAATNHGPVLSGPYRMPLGVHQTPSSATQPAVQVLLGGTGARFTWSGATNGYSINPEGVSYNTLKNNGLGIGPWVATLKDINGGYFTGYPYGVPDMGIAANAVATWFNVYDSYYATADLWQAGSAEGQASPVLQYGDVVTLDGTQQTFWSMAYPLVQNGNMLVTGYFGSSGSALAVLYAPKGHVLANFGTVSILAAAASNNCVLVLTTGDYQTGAIQRSCNGGAPVTLDTLPDIGMENGIFTSYKFTLGASANQVGWLYRNGTKTTLKIIADTDGTPTLTELGPVVGGYAVGDIYSLALNGGAAFGMVIPNASGVAIGAVITVAPNGATALAATPDGGEFAPTVNNGVFYAAKDGGHLGWQQ